MTENVTVTIAERDPSDVPPTQEPRCEVCGKPIPYAGRGRKPKRCSEHRKASSGTGTRRTGGTDLAVRAAEQLDILYGMSSALLRMLNCTDAAETLEMNREKLKAENVAFLSQDQSLARWLTKTSEATGRFGFIATNVMTIAPVISIAVQERAAARAEKRKAKEGEEGEDAIPAVSASILPGGMAV